MRQQQSQVKHLTAALCAPHRPAQDQHHSHPQEQSNQPRRQWRYGSEHTADEQAATETQQGALTEWPYDTFQPLQRTVQALTAAELEGV
jgi:hypothetical protein